MVHGKPQHANPWSLSRARQRLCLHKQQPDSITAMCAGSHALPDHMCADCDIYHSATPLTHSRCRHQPRAACCGAGGCVGLHSRLRRTRTTSWTPPTLRCWMRQTPAPPRMWWSSCCTWRARGEAGEAGGGLDEAGTHAQPDTLVVLLAGAAQCCSGWCSSS